MLIMTKRTEFMDRGVNINHYSTDLNLFLFTSSNMCEDCLILITMHAREDNIYARLCTKKKIDLH